MEDRVPYVEGDPCNPDRIAVGDMILDRYPNPTYYGMVIYKDDDIYRVEWFIETHNINTYWFSQVTRLSNNRIIKGEKEQLRAILKMDMANVQV